MHNDAAEDASSELVNPEARGERECPAIRSSRGRIPLGAFHIRLHRLSFLLSFRDGWTFEFGLSPV